jgi:PAS domain S-box-containing protein
MHFEHLTSLFENATEGIVLANTSGKIILINPAAKKMFGYDKGEIIGYAIEVLIPDQFKQHHKELRENFYHHPANRSMGQNRDLYGKKKDETLLPVEVSLSHYKKDGTLFIIAFIVDITKRKEIERNMKLQQMQLEKISNEIRKLNTELEVKVEERTMILKEALQRLEQSQDELSEALNKEKQLNEIKSRFVSMASHEFRTPLSTILSSASLLSKYTDTQDQEKRNRHIDKIKGSVRHLNDILEDFLSLGKLDEGKVEVNQLNFNLQECIHDIVDEMRGLQKKEQQVVIHFNGNPVIHSDKKMLRNVIINLLSNAVKFSKEDGIITINAKTQSNKITIAVKDEGIGIGKEDQIHLFSSFFRAANAFNIQGTGLGLHIVKRYIDMLCGTVELDSELNKGTTVTISIPQT